MGKKQRNRHFLAESVTVTILPEDVEEARRIRESSDPEDYEASENALTVALRRETGDQLWDTGPGGAVSLNDEYTVDPHTRALLLENSLQVPAGHTAQLTWKRGMW